MKVWGLDIPHHICHPMLAENFTSDVWVCLLVLSRREFMWGRHDTSFPALIFFGAPMKHDLR